MNDGSNGEVALPATISSRQRESVLARLPRPVALVVGGGGCLGAAHVGIGSALEDHGFVPDLIVGTSVGALNGAIAAAHPGTAAPWLASVWTHIHRPQVFPLRMPWRTRRAGGLFSPDGIRSLIARAGLPPRMEDLPVPFMAVATDVATGAPALLSAGELEPALLASAAIPGLLPPVERDGQLLVDGGVIAYVPVVAAWEAGAASLVVVSSGPESWPLRPRVPRRRAPSIAARSGLLVLHHQIERDLQEVSRHVPTVVLPTGIEDWPQPWDFGQSDRLIRTARAAALRFLDGLRITAGPRLYRGCELPEVERTAPAADQSRATAPGGVVH